MKSSDAYIIAANLLFGMAIIVATVTDNLLVMAWASPLTLNLLYLAIRSYYLNAPKDIYASREEGARNDVP